MTRLGRLIRPLRLDELPQLINVLKGDLTLVGPCPVAPSHVEDGGGQRRAHRIEVRPGLTGPTQLAWLDEEDRYPRGVDPGLYYVTHILPAKLESDRRYLETMSLAGDLGYLLQTPFALGYVVFRRLRLARFLKAARLGIDCLAVVAATYGAFLLRFDGRIPAVEVPLLAQGLVVSAGSYAVPFVWLRTYRSIWRYAGLEDFWKILGACMLGGVGAGAALNLLRSPYPRSVLVLTPILAIVLVGGIRLGFRTAVGIVRRIPRRLNRRRVVIVGAGALGVSITREILGTPDLGYEVVGFVDDDPRLQGATLLGVRVLGPTAQLSELARARALDEAIVAISGLPLTELRRIAESCAQAGLQFRTLPSVGQLIRGEGSLRYLRKVNPDELLDREPLLLDPGKVEAFLRDRRVMVTGAGGSIGAELCRLIASLGAESLMMVERAESGLFDICAELESRPSRTNLSAALADIKHVRRMTELFESFKPHVVFHAAAYKHVPMLESHPAEAVLNNVVGTARLARLAAAHGTEAFVLISTDKAVKPMNLMGATKRICELYVMAMNARQRALAGRGRRTEFRVVRFGNVLGSAGSVLPLFQRQIERGAPVTITDPEASRFFMTIREAVALVLESVMLDGSADILVLDMGKPVKIAQLAEDLVTALGLPPSAVPKEVVGLRPGEKMHETLLEDADEVRPSGHPRVVAVRQRGRPPAEIEEIVEAIERLALDGHVDGALAKVSELVPTYIPQKASGRPSMVRLNGAARMRDRSDDSVPSEEPPLAVHHLP